MLLEHLAARYRVRIRSVQPIDDDPATRPRGSWPGHHPRTMVVRRESGAPWIARVSAASPEGVGRIHGDAEILRFLAGQAYPAERLAHPEPVSVCEGSGVLLTEFLAGGRPTDEHGRRTTPAVDRELGQLLGRLHALPAAAGAMARPGGGPGGDLAAAKRLLVEVADRVTAASRPVFERLREAVETADDAAGLPEALTHNDFHAWAAVGAPGRLSITGWGGSGRGARLPDLAWLLTTTAEGGIDGVDAVVRGYREHVSLTDDEAARLPTVMAIRPLWLACLDFAQQVRRDPTRTPGSGWIDRRPEHARRTADRASAAWESA